MARRLTRASSAASGATTPPSATAPRNFVAGLIPPLNGLPMPATSGQQLNTFDAYDFSLNLDIGITDAVKLNSITGYHNWTNRSASMATCLRRRPSSATTRWITGSGARSCA